MRQFDTDSETPARCPVCSTPYDSVSVHDRGLLVNLLDNARYRRVCFEPVERDGRPHVRFFHHTHEQVGADESTRPVSPPNSTDAR
ncbi:hypothetical protein GJR98_13390 [Haloferax sp. MBLA0077]|uniref:DUF8145 domain-containing protein n=2 Tax=Haloferax TaxID=2251 RepID=A0A6G1Z584_9EURY|nr:hypothetical protein [Haloferax marinisediminis]KAB1188978.1 hypothetical protein Hfx1149_13405 [Haloferax sp. CBA1149]MRW81702.1 hypothetical protein [Haloferax marinisediminis]